MDKAKTRRASDTLSTSTPDTEYHGTPSPAKLTSPTKFTPRRFIPIAGSDTSHQPIEKSDTRRFIPIARSDTGHHPIEKSDTGHHTHRHLSKPISTRTVHTEDIINTLELLNLLLKETNAIAQEPSLKLVKDLIDYIIRKYPQPDSAQNTFNPLTLKNEDVAQRNQINKIINKLAEIFSDVFKHKIDEVSVDDNYFNLGHKPLLKLVEKVNMELGSELGSVLKINDYDIGIHDKFSYFGEKPLLGYAYRIILNSNFYVFSIGFLLEIYLLNRINPKQLLVKIPQISSALTADDDLVSVDFTRTAPVTLLKEEYIRLEYLLAIQLAERINEKLNCNISAEDVLDNPTLTQLISCIDQFIKFKNLVNTLESYHEILKHCPTKAENDFNTSTLKPILRQILDSLYSWKPTLKSDTTNRFCLFRKLFDIKNSAQQSNDIKIPCTTTNLN